MTTGYNKNICFKIIDVIMMGYAIALLTRFIRRVILSCGLDTYNITEFLINYQGGYVRRGLFGEILYKIYQLVPNFDPRWIIVPLCSVCFILFIWFILKKFKENNFCWWILPLSVCLFGASDIIRKDYMCMLMASLILYSFVKIPSVSLKYAAVSLLSILVINLHECSFFFIGCFLLLMMAKDKGSVQGWKLMGIACLLTSMGIVCIFKGNRDIAYQIWSSWEFYPNHLFDSSSNDSIRALGWNSTDTFKSHFSMNFLTYSHGILCWFSKPIIWCTTIYVTLNIMFMRRGWENNRCSDDTKRLLSIMLIQFVSLIPMFTVLSCDGSRVCFYWTLSSMLIYFIIPNDKCLEVIPRHVQTIAEKLQRIIYFRHSTKLAIFLMMFLSITNVGTDLRCCIENSVIGVYHLLFQYIITGL